MKKSALRQTDKGAHTRAIAAQICHAVSVEGRSLDNALTQHEQNSPERDRALLRELCYGSIRWYFPLKKILGSLLNKPIKQRDIILHSLLIVGLYQLFYLRIPAYATIASTTEATRLLDKAWASGLINGVLRQAQRRQENLQQVLDTANSHSAWLSKLLKQAWPEDWQTIVSANDQHPPQNLRVNLNKISRSEYLTQLSSQGIAAQANLYSAAGIDLQQSLDVQQLPRFDQGWCSIQDPAAQLAAPLLVAPLHTIDHPLRILDACAAPGGKSCHILEQNPDTELWALDKSASRMRQLQQNLARLQLSAHTMIADAAALASWWDGQLFDCILLDAPCSGTGVIRRHPDIKLLRRADDIPRLAEQQLGLLQALWPLLKRSGYLLYASCSVLPAETSAVIDTFCSAQSDARPDAIMAEWGQQAGFGRQILPGSMDGFFYARLHKSN